MKSSLLFISLFVTMGFMGGCNNESNDQPITGDPTTNDNPSNSGNDNSASGNNPADGNTPDLINLNDATPVEGSLVGNVLKQGDIVVADGKTSSTNDFSFPDLVSNPSTGEDVLVISNELLPEQASQRELTKGTGAAARMGDIVTIRYDMFSWSTGELVDSSHRLEEQSLKVTLGDLVSGNPVPMELNNALLNRTEGTRLQVVFPRLMPDLPDTFNRYDAYVLMVDIDTVEPFSPLD